MSRLESSRIQTTEASLLEDKCGIFAVYSPEYSDKLPITMRGAGGVQHRGQQGVGFAAQTEDGTITYTRNGLIREALTSHVIRRNGLNMASRWQMFHCRYGTEGGYIKNNLQPCKGVTDLGEEFTLVHNGQVLVTDKEKQKYAPRGKKDLISDTYILTQKIASAEGATLEDKIEQVLAETKGSYSIIIGAKDRLILARDEQGIMPFVIGKAGNTFIAASETHAIDKVDAQVVREVKRGEIVRIDSEGVKTLKKGKDGAGNFCSFQLGYFMRPDSMYPIYNQAYDGEHPENWISVARFREECGKTLWKERPVKDASFVVGIPDSGVAVGTGLAIAAGIPYRQVILRDHYDPNGDKRLFQGDDKLDLIQSKVLGKLSLVPDPAIWEDAIVIIGEDSVVRGNVMKPIVRAIFSLGAREVHVRSGYPMIIAPCHLGVSMRKEEELIALRNKGDERLIAQELAATTAGFISNEGYLMAQNPNRELNIPENPREMFLQNGQCGGCLTGNYPVSREGILFERKGDLLLV